MKQEKQIRMLRERPAFSFNFFSLFPFAPSPHLAAVDSWLAERTDPAVKLMGIGFGGQRQRAMGRDLRTSDREQGQGVKKRRAAVRVSALNFDPRDQRGVQQRATQSCII
jgi:hypothetical protein